MTSLRISSLICSHGMWTDSFLPWFVAKEGQLKHGDGSKVDNDFVVQFRENSGIEFSFKYTNTCTHTHTHTHTHKHTHINIQTSLRKDLLEFMGYQRGLGGPFLFPFPALSPLVSSGNISTGIIHKCCLGSSRHVLASILKTAAA
jgi:hypothetical protein